MLVDLGIPGISAATPIGSGGHGDVYRALEDDFDRVVAVKVVRTHLHGGSAELFDREMRAQGRLSGHQGVIGVFRRGMLDDGRPWAVMEFAHEGSLADRLDRVGPVGPVTAASWCAQASDALAYAHALGIIHRDVKPGNLLLGLDRRLRVADFGIALVRDLARMTPYGAVRGTLEYTDPAVLTGAAQPSPASDVYSLAVTLLRLVGLSEAPGPDAAAGLPPMLRDVALAALRETAEARPTMRELGNVLRQVAAAPALRAPVTRPSPAPSAPEAATLSPARSPRGHGGPAATSPGVSLSVAADGHRFTVLSRAELRLYAVSGSGNHHVWRRHVLPLATIPQFAPGDDGVTAAPVGRDVVMLRDAHGVLFSWSPDEAPLRYDGVVDGLWAPTDDEVITWQQGHRLQRWGPRRLFPGLSPLWEPISTMGPNISREDVRTILAVGPSPAERLYLVVTDGTVAAFVRSSGASAGSARLPRPDVRVASNWNRSVQVLADPLGLTVFQAGGGRLVHRRVAFAPEVSRRLIVAAGRWTPGDVTELDGRLFLTLVLHDESTVDSVHVEETEPGRVTRRGFHTDWGVLEYWRRGEIDGPLQVVAPLDGITNGFVGVSAAGRMWLLGDLGSRHEGLPEG